MAKIKRIGVLTSGGDAPGMNAAIRAVTRTAIFNGLEVIGIRHGYLGMINANFKPLKAHNVSDTIQRGGTILKTARCEEFKTPEGRRMAFENLLAAEIDGVVIIGGDGSFTGARIFVEEY
ncbi:MAG TPA: 6-phosphofructokinase, partial [Bacteroidales bacterium]|nr:6-phosphofructokinase [Bacteroidales bacterium]